MTSMRLPSTVPPKSSTAMRAARYEPGPVLSDCVPLMSVRTPILTTSSDTWACAAAEPSAMARTAASRQSVFVMRLLPFCRHARPRRSFVKRSTGSNNLNVRMHSRRVTRLTNAFPKKVENHAHVMALHFMYYNFVRIHKTLRTTPAMAAGATNRLWEVCDMVTVLEAWERSGDAVQVV